MDIITITVARLPSRMDMKKVMKQSIHNSLRCDLVLMDCDMMLKPPCASTMSMMAMEPSTKKRVVDTSPKPLMSFFSMKAKAMSWTGIERNSGNTSKNWLMCLGGFIKKKCSALSRKMSQRNMDIPTAVAALLTLMTSSKAIAIIPRMNITGMR